jgi:hypothetical protein
VENLYIFFLPNFANRLGDSVGQNRLRVKMEIMQLEVPFPTCTCNIVEASKAV